MKKVECIARTLCKWEGRNDNHYNTPDQQQWRRYEPQARAVLRALKASKKLHGKLGALSGK